MTIEKQEQADTPIPGPLPTRWQVAVHEAAHATYAYAHNITVPNVTVEGVVAVEASFATEGGSPEAESGVLLGKCHLRGKKPALLTRCALSLAGPAAEYRVDWPEPLPPDYAGLVRYCEVCRPGCDCEYAEVLAELQQAEDPETLYEQARAEAEAFVTEQWSDITRLAEKLMEAVRLDKEGVELVFDPAWPKFEEYLNELRLADDAAPWTRFESEEEG